ncbi:hypothetical protein [Lachnoclostridium phytofermentans]|uniref:Lipoprotein n=1 Tax=Lachnoclostridium phytofermentans (strain ATCC 700394 / DSM 18823 / ISDg) TaxID=357809 RepID=A9KI95_LACP7|nr:hypothetical protein [Lachnoclostridium phytofermentans]ABX40929.1 hypothetical protein Cphy_0542 [Lachnoclostridium phytofermentans ISDg]
MKKCIISSLVVVLFAALLVSCSPKESNYSLHLLVDSWSDQNIDYPENEFYYENLISKKTYDIPLRGSAFLREFKVVKIDSNSITISTSESYSDNEDGHVFASEKKKFVIEYGKSKTIYTRSMDAGESYVFTLVEKN